MSDAINDGGPAFPCPVEFDPNGQLVSHGSFGMSLRDWFAGNETLSDYDHPASWDHYVAAINAINGPSPDCSIDPTGYYRWEFEARAKMKLMRADAMLAARKGGQP